MATVVHVCSTSCAPSMHVWLHWACSYSLYVLVLICQLVEWQQLLLYIDSTSFGVQSFCSLSIFVNAHVVNVELSSITSLVFYPSNLL